MQAEIELKRQELAADLQLQQQKAQMDMAMRQQEAQQQMALEKERLEREPSGEAKDIGSAVEGAIRKRTDKDKQESSESLKAVVENMMKGMESLVGEIKKPRVRVPVRDKNGRIVSVEERDAAK